jgi:hypothetical protein
MGNSFKSRTLSTQQIDQPQNGSSLAVLFQHIHPNAVTQLFHVLSITEVNFLFVEFIPLWYNILKTNKCILLLFLFFIMETYNEIIQKVP